MSTAPSFGDLFCRFIAYLADDPTRCDVAARLQREGVDLPHIFSLLLRYVIPGDADKIVKERKTRHRQDRAIFNLGVRKNGVPPGIGSWLIARSELARSTKGLGRQHSTDYLVVAHVALEVQAKRKVSTSELAYLVEAVNYATSRRPLSVDPNTIAHELRRHRKAHPNFIPILKSKTL